MSPTDSSSEQHHGAVAEALSVLGKDNVVLVIHDASHPSAPDEDTGCGTPYGTGGAEFLRFARGLGFDGVQFGPQGQTTRANPSPYDGTLFSKNALSIALGPLVRDPRWRGLLRRETLDAIVSARPPVDGRGRYEYAFDAQRYALGEAFGTFLAVSPGTELETRYLAFRDKNARWLERDALFEALSVEHGTDDVRRWPDGRDRSLFALPEDERAARSEELRARHGRAVEFHAFCQFVAHSQHEELRTTVGGWGMKLFGDLQIGFSPRDAWAYRALFLNDYVMGAPPSRTNPDGQPWGYPVYDPGQQDGAVVSFLRMRMTKMLSEFDGVRIDHPHGLVCPWVYRADTLDPLAAVRAGARLFESPDVPDHPALAAYAIARVDQIDRSVPRHADARVTALSSEQVDAYARLLDVVVECAHAAGRAPGDVLCEVLSTCPYPLQRVMEKHGLGRFRVTQKADVTRPDDVYRSENAVAADWIMVGNHDTDPLWRVVDGWQANGQMASRAMYLAERLVPDPGARAAFAQRLAADPREMAQAQFADVFASRARNVMVFFPDLFGMREVYNRPGVVNDDNWMLRVPNGYAGVYAERAARREALCIPYVLAMALRARGVGDEHRGLIERLEGAGQRRADVLP